MTRNDTPYFGSDEIKALQRAQDSDVDALRDTPGAVIHARTFSTDDPERLGWDRLRERMVRDGRVTLRGADLETVARAAEALADFTPSRHHWDIFLGTRTGVAAACRPLAAQPLPDGLTAVSPDEIDDALLRRAQAFMDAQGVSPFSVDALAGRLFSAQMVVIRDAQDGIAATAFAAMTHNRHSPFAGIAWVGLVAVAPDHRGRSLGKHIDALANLAAIDELGAEGTMEFVAQGNVPSRRMLEACGLRHREGISVTMLSTSDARLTR